MNPSAKDFDSVLSPRLSPAEGLDSAASLYTAPPIESLEFMKELGAIAAASLPQPVPTAAPGGEQTSMNAAPVVGASNNSAPAATPTNALPNAGNSPTSDSRLLEALLEYHRQRGPKLGARMAPRPSTQTGFSRVDSSSEPRERFSSVEIPIIQDFVPKTNHSGQQARPMQAILKPKPRS